MDGSTSDVVSAKLRHIMSAATGGEQQLSPGSISATDGGATADVNAQINTDSSGRQLASASSPLVVVRCIPWRPPPAPRPIASPCVTRP